MLKKLGTGQGFLKAGFQGFQGSGKTFTACLLAAVVRKQFGLKGPIAMVDSENATEYVAPLIKLLTGEDLVGERTREFTALVPLAQECIKEGVSVLIVDSATHFWRNLCDSYLSGVNEMRARKNQPARSRLEFADWNPIKGQWGTWTDAYLNLPLHIIIAGRAGYEYDMAVNQETGRKELEKTGIKMKTESEFGYEPSILTMMELDQQPTKDGRFEQVRTAIILKDRFGAIDGSQFIFRRGGSRQEEMDAVAKAFMPHIAMLKPGTHSTVHTAVSAMEVSEEGDVAWVREKRERAILTEEVQGCIVSSIPGMGAEDKKRKADLLQLIFGTRSWTKVESMNSDILRDGLERLRKHLGIDQPAEAKDDLPFGPESPQDASKPPEPPHIPPEAPKAPISQDVANLDAFKAVRDLASTGPLTEDKLVELLKKLGSVAPDTNSIEQILLARPQLLKVVADNWQTYVNAAKEWLEEKKQ